MSSTVLGVLLLTRHGDRQGFYQSPIGYTASNTAITPLGEVQEHDLGTLLRSLYLNSSSPSHIEGISTGLFQADQVLLKADAGGEGGVIFDSAIALAQGLWPTTVANTIQLANGTNVTSPLGGYQYVPVESVEPEEDVSMEGWTQCPAFDVSNKQVYSSAEFTQVQNDNANFLSNLIAIVSGRAVSLQNMWNIFDYMNVQYIHNATFAASCSPQTLSYARALANYHERSVFSSTNLSSIQNIPGQAILPTMLDSLDRIANSTDPLKLVSLSISYKPFLSLFNMMGVSSAEPDLSGIINYAGSVAFEVRSSNGSAPFVRFSLKNGTQDTSYSTHPIFGQSDMPLSDFTSKLEPYGLKTLGAWCNTCGNNSTRGCDLISAVNTSSIELAQARNHHQAVSPVAAGFIGAGLTVFTALSLLVLAALCGLVTLGRGARRKQRAGESTSGAEEAQTSAKVGDLKY